MSEIIHKVLTEPVEKANDDGAYRFVISSEDVDLVGDIVVQAGLTPVSERIPAQVDHSGKMADMIGVWRNLQTRAKKTYADLHLFERGVSPMADMVRQLLDMKVQLAASIGFVPIDDEYEFIEGGRGIRFLRSILHETSVVVTPANPTALSVVKSHGFDPARLRTSAQPKSVHQNILRARSMIRRADKTLSIR